MLGTFALAVLYVWSSFKSDLVKVGYNGKPQPTHCSKAFREMPKKLSAGRCYDHKDQPGLLRCLKTWLTHNASLVKEGQYWPLVVKARVSGPWSVLAPNLVFVDLPGTGDTNAVRNEIAHREFKRADFVCVCARVDRAVTDKASLQWLDKSLRDMPRENVAYVVTKCDDVSADEVKRDHGLRRGSCSKAAERRNDSIKQQLVPKSVKVFTVSSRDYARCIGLEDGVPAAFLTEDATEIPGVRKHIVDSVKSRKIKAETIHALTWYFDRKVSLIPSLFALSQCSPQLPLVYWVSNSRAARQFHITVCNFRLEKRNKMLCRRKQARRNTVCNPIQIAAHWAIDKASILMGRTQK